MLAVLVVLPALAPLNPVVRVLMFYADHVHGLWFYAYVAKPVEGSIALKGLKSTVTVAVDGYGVPHIYAEKEEDAFTVLGWIQARDRFWQMDVLRRIGYGNLSALLGPAALKIDKFMRTLGYHITIEKSYELVKKLAMEGDVWAQRALVALEAYTRGVNAWLDHALKTGSLPLEYRLLGVLPEPWKPQDSIAVAMVMIHGLAYGATDVMLASLAAAGHSWIIDLMFKATKWLSNTTIIEPNEWSKYVGIAKDLKFKPTVKTASIEDVEELNVVVNFTSLRPYLLALANLTNILQLVLGSTCISNNWVISGSLVKQGAPILANDPHLELTVPPIWYEYHIVALDTGLNMHGVGFPGIPFIIIGRNKYVAVGYTNSMIDVTDFYYYVWINNETYLYMGEPRKVELRVERILVRELTGRYQIVEHRVLETVHGPILEVNVSGSRVLLAVKTTTTIPSAVVVWAYRIMHARSVFDVLEVQRYFYAPIQNTVAADVHGNILYSPAGLIPVRTRLPKIAIESANGTVVVTNAGFLPFNGSRGEGEWIGYVAFRYIPRLLNPERGYVVTANNLIVPDYPYYLQLAVCDRYRFQRIVQLIEEVLAAKGFISVEDVKTIQLDTTSLAAFNLVMVASKLAGYQVISQWDYKMRVDDYRPSIAYVFLYALHDTLWRRVFRAAGLEPDYGCRGLRLELTEFILRLALAGDTWFLERLGYADARQLIKKALESTMKLLTSLYGTTEVQQWIYGSKHRYTIRHVLGDYFPWLNYPEYPAPGDPYTVNPSPEREPGKGVRHGASVRFVALLAANATVVAWLQIPGGNSGNPFSRFFDNQLRGWVLGEYHPVILEDSLVELSNVLTLVSRATFEPGR
jgi:penicillin amidase